MADRTKLEKYDPHPDAWRPSGNRPSLWRRDTPDTMLELDDRPPRPPRQVNPDTLPHEQRIREQAYTLGQITRRQGKARNSTKHHKVKPSELTTSDLAFIAAFELGWDTENRKLAAS